VAEQPVEFKGAWRLLAKEGSLLEEGQGALAFLPDAVGLVTSAGGQLEMLWRDFASLASADYVLSLRLHSGEQLDLFKLGARYEEAIEEAARLRADALASALLIDEPVLHRAYEATIRIGERPPFEGELRLYDSRLGLVPRASLPWVLEYSRLTSVQLEGATYELVLQPAAGEPVRLGKLGARAAECQELLSQLIARHRGRTQQALQNTLAGLDSMALRRAAGLMADGKCASKAELDSVAPEAWAALELACLTKEERKPYYEALKTISPVNALRFGLKQVTATGFEGQESALPPVADETGREFPVLAWLLAPLGPEGAPVAIAWEVLTEGDHATYGFWLDASQGQADLEELQRCLQRVQFRREPLGASATDLTEQLGQYALAVEQVPELVWLRKRLMGRAIHATPESWAQSVKEWAGG